MNLKNFENKCITCVRCDIIEEVGEKKTQCDQGLSYGKLDDGCEINYVKDESSFNTEKIHELLGDDFVLEEDFK